MGYVCINNQQTGEFILRLYWCLVLFMAEIKGHILQEFHFFFWIASLFFLKSGEIPSDDFFFFFFNHDGGISKTDHFDSLIKAQTEEWWTPESIFLYDNVCFSSRHWKMSLAERRRRTRHKGNIRLVLSWCFLPSFLCVIRWLMHIVFLSCSLGDSICCHSCIDVSGHSGINTRQTRRLCSLLCHTKQALSVSQRMVYVCLLTLKTCALTCFMTCLFSQYDSWCSFLFFHSASSLSVGCLCGGALKFVWCLLHCLFSLTIFEYGSGVQIVKIGSVLTGYRD